MLRQVQSESTLAVHYYQAQEVYRTFDELRKQILAQKQIIRTPIVTPKDLKKTGKTFFLLLTSDSSRPFWPTLDHFG